MIKATEKLTKEQSEKMMEIYTSGRQALFENPMSFMPGICAGNYNGENFSYIQNIDFFIVEK